MTSEIAVMNQRAVALAADSAVTLIDGGTVVVRNDQRKLYNLALFNEVDTAVQNPSAEQPRKNVLLLTTEAKRWDVTYGFGFQAQMAVTHQHYTTPWLEVP